VIISWRMQRKDVAYIPPTPIIWSPCTMGVSHKSVALRPIYSAKEISKYFVKLQVHISSPSRTPSEVKPYITLLYRGEPETNISLLCYGDRRRQHQGTVQFELWTDETVSAVGPHEDCQPLPTLCYKPIYFKEDQKC
jgi:hypothetical protein